MTNLLFMIIAFIFINYFVQKYTYQLNCSTKKEILFKISCYLNLDILHIFTVKLQLDFDTM